MPDFRQSVYLDEAEFAHTPSTPAVLRHLERLTAHFTYHGQRIAYIHIYATPDFRYSAGAEPALTFITARESGFEGVACVDDVARAATLALQCYHQTSDPAALRLARAWLGFVRYMQEPDGRFVNFIKGPRGVKNYHGATSYPGGAWWTLRALEALMTAYQVTGDREALDRARACPLPALTDYKLMAVAALVWLQWYETEPRQPHLRSQIYAWCDAITGSGLDYFRNVPGEAEPAMVMFGYQQLRAVARAGRLLGCRDYIWASERTVRNLIEPIIAGGFYHVYPTEQNQMCVYDVSSIALGLEEVYHATGNPRYRDLALRCVAWLQGANRLGLPLYHAAHGRCSDGIDNGALNPNAGAESAIEAGYIALLGQRLSAPHAARDWPAV